MSSAKLRRHPPAQAPPPHPTEACFLFVSLIYLFPALFIHSIRESDFLRVCQSLARRMKALCVALCLVCLDSSKHVHG